MLSLHKHQPQPQRTMKTGSLLSNAGSQQTMTLFTSGGFRPSLKALVTLILLGGSMVLGLATPVSPNIGTNIAVRVSWMTADLLSTTSSVAERQRKHASNFNELSIGARPYYLYAVAYGVARLNTGGNTVAEFMANVDAADLAAAEIAQHLLSLESFDEMPPDASEASETVTDTLMINLGVLQELNLLLAPKIANSPDFQDAILYGVWHGLLDAILSMPD